MDPVSIISIVDASLNLALKCASTVNKLNDVASKYKNAKLTVLSITQSLDTMQFAWGRIGAWAETYKADGNTAEYELFLRMARLLETGALVMEALEEELLGFDTENITMNKRFNLIWNESALQAHQNRIRDQAASMTLLLQTTQLPTSIQRIELIQKSENHFKKSDESAYSIVPSHLSVRTQQTDDSGSIANAEDLTYRKLSFEDDLFNGMVYKRNFIKYMLLDDQKSKPNQRASTLISVRPASTAVGKKRHRQIHDGTTSKTYAENMSKDDIVSYKELERSGGSLPELIGRANNLTSNLDSQRTSSPGPTPNFLRAKKKGKELSGETKNEKSYLDILHAFPSPSSGNPIIMPREEARESNEVLLQVDELREHASPDPQAHLAGQNSDGSEFQCRSSPERLTGYSQRQGNGQAFLDACEQGDIETTEAFLKDGAHLQAQLRSSADPNMEAIHVASRYGQTGIVRQLLDNGAGLEAETTSSGSRPLHLAAESGNALLTRLLLQRGADVSPRNHHGEQPIHLASKTGVLEVLDVLVGAGAAVDTWNDNGLRPLDIAAGALDQPDVIHFLFRKGARINASVCNDIGRPLHLACRQNLAGNVRALIDLYPEFSTEDCISNDQCLLNSAIDCESYAALEALLLKGISPTHSHRRGLTSLHNLVSNMKPNPLDVTAREKMLEILLEHKANLNVQDENGDTPLHKLASLDPTKYAKTSVQLARLLLSYRAKPYLWNKNGETPLFLAIRQHNAELSKILIDTGAKLVKTLCDPQSEVCLNKVTTNTIKDFEAPDYELHMSGLDDLVGKERKARLTMFLDMYNDFHASSIIPYLSGRRKSKFSVAARNPAILFYSSTYLEGHDCLEEQGSLKEQLRWMSKVQKQPTRQTTTHRGFKLMGADSRPHNGRRLMPVI